MYTGAGQDWIANSFGGILYVIFWCLVVLLIAPKLQPGNISFGVLFFTCVLEFMQLWHPPFLQALRSTFVGATILGTSFVASDFIYYIVGAIIGWLFLLAIKGIAGRERKENIRHATNL